WQLAAAAGGACVMTFSNAPSAPAGPSPQGSIAPEAGCPGNFFTSRKWTFEGDKLVIRDFKGRPLTQLSYLGAHFEGHDKNGGALTLSKQQ
ncbi:MAG: AprI/Inh family metalloprotease inhibitor, partial [Xanthobacteraceae bacterium]